jgi:hypothetical protein
MSEQLTNRIDTSATPPDEIPTSSDVESSIAKHRDFVASLSSEKREAYEAVMKEGYRRHGAAFTDKVLGLEPAQPYKNTSVEPVGELAPSVKVPSEVVDDAESLVEAVMVPRPAEQLTRHTVETSLGLVERVDADLGEGVHMGVLSDTEGVRAIDVAIDEGNEHHTVAVLEPESQTPQVIIDGEPAKEEDVPVVQSVIAHIKEEVNNKNSEKPKPEDEESKDAGPRPEQPDKEIEQKRAKFALDFVKAYASNPVTREYLKRAGINLSELGERFQSGEVAVDEDQIAQMRQLMKEAHFKGSSIWDTQPGGRSALQQVADQKRLELTNILRQF